MSQYIIDVKTQDAYKLVEQLKAQPWVIAARPGGQYIQDPNYSQVRVFAGPDKDEKFIDDWLYYDSEDIDWVGVAPAGD